MDLNLSPFCRLFDGKKSENSFSSTNPWPPGKTSIEFLPIYSWFFCHQCERQETVPSPTMAAKAKPVDWSCWTWRSFSFTLRWSPPWLPTEHGHVCMFLCISVCLCLCIHIHIHIHIYIYIFIYIYINVYYIYIYICHTNMYIMYVHMYTCKRIVYVHVYVPILTCRPKAAMMHIIHVRLS